MFVMKRIKSKEYDGALQRGVIYVPVGSDQIAVGEEVCIKRRRDYMKLCGQRHKQKVYLST